MTLLVFVFSGKDPTHGRDIDGEKRRLPKIRHQEDGTLMSPDARQRAKWSLKRQGSGMSRYLLHLFQFLVSPRVRQDNRADQLGTSISKLSATEIDRRFAAQCRFSAP